MSAIVLATPSRAFEQRVRQAVARDLGDRLVQLWHEDFEEQPAAAILEWLLAPQPSVVVLGPGLEPAVLLALADQFDQQAPEVSVIAVTPSSPEVLQQAMRVGVRDLIEPTSDRPTIQDVVERAAAAADRRRSKLVGGEHPQRRGRIITVISAKGGVGKTTVASNVAVALSAAPSKEVAIVDFDVAFGDVASALGLTPEHSVANGVGGGPLDMTSVKVWLTPHESGVFALCAPDDPAVGEELTTDVAMQMLELMAEAFDYVVVDTASGLDALTLSIMESSDELLCVAGMDVPSVRDLGKELSALDRIGLTGPRRHLVVNRSDSRVGLALQDVSATLDMPVSAAIPSSKAVPLALNRGVPLVRSDGRSPAGRALIGLAAVFADIEVPSGGGLFGRR